MEVEKYMFDIDEKRLDALREISNIGAGNAMTALHQMTNRIISLEVPDVMILPFREVADTMGGIEEEVMGLFFKVYGAYRGNLLIVLPRTSMEKLLSILFNSQRKEGHLGEMEISCLKEVGNILCGAYLNAIGSILKISLIPSIPAFSLDMALAVIDSLLIEISCSSDNALVIQTDFHTRDGELSGHFFLLPDPPSLNHLIMAVESVLKSP